MCNGVGVSVWEEGNVLEVDGGDTGRHLSVPKATKLGTVVKMVNFVCILPWFKKILKRVVLPRRPPPRGEGPSPRRQPRRGEGLLDLAQGPSSVMPMGSPAPSPTQQGDPPPIRARVSAGSLQGSGRLAGRCMANSPDAPGPRAAGGQQPCSPLRKTQVPGGQSCAGRRARSR